MGDVSPRTYLWTNKINDPYQTRSLTLVGLSYARLRKKLKEHVKLKKETKANYYQSRYRQNALLITAIMLIYAAYPPFLKISTYEQMSPLANPCYSLPPHSGVFTYFYTRFRKKHSREITILNSNAGSKYSLALNP